MYLFEVFEQFFVYQSAGSLVQWAVHCDHVTLNVEEVSVWTLFSLHYLPETRIAGHHIVRMKLEIRLEIANLEILDPPDLDSFSGS